MKNYTYWIVDSFSQKPYRGNPAAIVFEADDLSDERMQTIARYLNLSETVFLCRPETEEADYRARIFTPREEIPFAGHPTIASAFAHSSGIQEAPHGRAPKPWWKSWRTGWRVTGVKSRGVDQNCDLVFSALPGASISRGALIW